MTGTHIGGVKSADKIKRQRGSDYYKIIGKTGGLKSDKNKSAKTTKERYGQDFYKRIGKLGAEKRKRNILRKNMDKTSELI